MRAGGSDGSASAASSHELNRLLRGATDTTFPSAPRRAARRRSLRHHARRGHAAAARDRQALIGKMAHPLNRPRFDAASGRVVEGYGILQPRVTPSLPMGREGSLFQRVFSSAIGIDPYAAAVSDVYQDLFGEGSLYGQGHLRRRRLRSGARRPRARDTPAQPRPVRGHLRARRPGLGRRGRRGFPVHATTSPPLATTAGRAATGSCCPGSLVGGRKGPIVGRGGGVPAIGRWKMLDNLRRSLSAPSIVVALIAGWACRSRRGRLDGFHPVDDRAAAALPVSSDIAGAARG